MKLDFRYIFATLILFCFLAFAGIHLYESQQQLLPPLLPPLSASQQLISGMHMTFDDEFNTFNEYLANGNVTCGPGGTGTWQTMYYNCTRTTASNDEAQIYDASSTSAANGVLTIAAIPTPNQTLPYTSGLITTQYSFSQTYGYFEIRAQLPAGGGLWPAFWLLPVDQSWPPEIDAMEAFGDTNPVNDEGGHTMIHYASHTPPNNQVCGAWFNTGIDITAGFHTYGVDWEPSGITYYFDGTPYASCPPNPAANKPFYILINLAVGGMGSWPGTPSSTTTWPAEMKIDYVRAYQN
jgi:beta-glucanase (GH16 family)